MESKFDELLEHPPVVVNLGVQEFAEALASLGVRVIHVEWSPPAGGDAQMVNLLDKLL